MYKKIFSVFLKTNTFSLMVRTINDNRINLFKPLMYASSNQLQKEKVIAIIDEFNENLKNVSGKCMDIGCGPGDITKEIILPALDPNATIIGTDIEENMIEYAKKNNSVKNRLEYEVLDIQTKKLPTKYVSQFDHVFSFHSLHWCNYLIQAFENIYRMLRSNGTMLVLFVSSHDIFKILENLAHNDHFAPFITDVNKYMWPFQHSINPRKELKELLQLLGFTIIHCSHRETYFFNQDPNKFLYSILSCLHFIDNMPYDRKEEFKTIFKRKFAEAQITYEQKDQKKIGKLDVYNVLIVFAQKHIP